MLQQLFKRNLLIRSDSGAYLIIFAVSLFVVLSVVGLAIDSARLYWTKAELQRAVDASALSGARLLVTQPALPYNAVRDRTREVLAENLRLMKVKNPQIANIIAQVAPESHSICFNNPNDSSTTCADDPTDPNVARKFAQVEVTLNQPTYILGLIPGFWNSNLVSAQGFVENLQLEISLVLDSTGSMSQDFSGLYSNQAGYAAPQKIDSLRSSANTLIDTLLPFDKMGIVTFTQDINGSDSSFVKDAKSEPSALPTPANWDTVKADYLNDARLDLAMTRVIDPGPVDNRPAMRLVLTNMNPNNGTNIGAGLRLGRQLFVGPLPPKTLRVMVLVTDGATNTGEPLTWFNAVSPDLKSEGPDRPLIQPSAVPPKTCSNTMLPPPATGTTHARLQFLDSIIESDLVRDQGYMIYTVGLGFADTSCDTPFQNPSSDQLKVHFLQRIANDQDKMRSGAPPCWNPTPSPTPDPACPWDFPCVRTCKDLQGKHEGTFELASNAAELQEIFKKIAEIRMKMTQ